MPHLLIVADDLTGAADTGACFAARGLATVIPLSGAASDADVVVLSTETRDLDGADAARIVAAAVAGRLASHGEVGPRWIYKKIDSAFRGNPRAEVLATMSASGENRVLVAPAFPAEGRTTVGGRQFVDGLPLAESPLGVESTMSDIAAVFANDQDLPVRILGLPSIRDQPEEIAAVLEADPAGILVADAATDDDLLALARAASRTSLRLLCGTAGFARALAHTLPLHRVSSSAPRPRTDAQPVLVVAGSQNDAAKRQIDVVAKAGMPVVRPSQGVVDGEESDDDVVSEVAASLAMGRSTVLTTAGLAASPLGGRAVSERLAQVVVSPRILHAIGGLVLTGGDVAAAVLTALGASALRLGGEIAPGQPWGVLEGGAVPGLLIATKAGSFGGDDALLACIAFLTANDEARPQP